MLPASSRRSVRLLALCTFVAQGVVLSPIGHTASIASAASRIIATSARGHPDDNLFRMRMSAAQAPVLRPWPLPSLRLTLTVAQDPKAKHRIERIIATLSKPIGDGRVRFAVRRGTRAQELAACTPMRGTCGMFWSLRAIGSVTIIARWTGDRRYLATATSIALPAVRRTWAYRGIWRGKPVARLVLVVPSIVMRNLRDHAQTGRTLRFFTGNPAYACLNGRNLPVYTAPREFPRQYVVSHSIASVPRCATGTWLFPQQTVRASAVVAPGASNVADVARRVLMIGRGLIATVAVRSIIAPLTPLHHRSKATPTVTAAGAPTATDTPTAIAPLPTSTQSAIVIPADTPTTMPTATATSAAATSTPTLDPPSATATITLVPATPTPTATSVPPKSTPSPTATSVPATLTPTVDPPSATPTPTPSATPNATPPTATAAPPPGTATPISPEASNLLQNGSFENTGTNWLAPWDFHVQAGTGAAATISQDTSTAADGAASAQINVTQPVAAPWDVQLSQGIALLTQGHTYTISFWAKAATPRSIAYALKDGLTNTLYLSANANLSTTWQPVSTTYTHLAANDSNTSLQFNLAQTAGQIWIDGVVVTGPATPSGTTTTTPVPATGTATSVPTTRTATATTTPVPTTRTATATTTPVPTSPTPVLPPSTGPIFDGVNVDICLLNPNSPDYVKNSKGQDLIEIAAHLGINFFRVNDGGPYGCANGGSSAGGAGSASNWGLVLNKMAQYGIQAQVVSGLGGGFGSGSLSWAVAKVVNYQLGSYPNVYGYDLVNEPILNDTSISYLLQARQQIKAVYPNLRLTVGGWKVAGGTYGCPSNIGFCWQRPQDAQLLEPVVDYFSPHIYEFDRPMNGPYPDPYTLTSNYFDGMLPYTAGKPILIGEYGAGNGREFNDQVGQLGSPELQANATDGVLRAVRAYQNRGVVGSAQWAFYNRSLTCCGTPGWDLLYNNGDSILPAAYVIQKDSTGRSDIPLRLPMPIVSTDYVFQNTDSGRTVSINQNGIVGFDLTFPAASYSLQVSNPSIFTVTESLEPGNGTYKSVLHAVGTGTATVSILANNCTTNCQVFQMALQVS